MNYLDKFRDLMDPKNPKIKGLKNCHLEGVHSFVLDEDDGLFTRMFIATEDHLLWKNHCGILRKGWDVLSVGIHSHHTDIELYPVSGIVFNVEFIRKVKKGKSRLDCRLKKFQWKSEILTGTGGFHFQGSEELTLKSITGMLPTRKYSMKSSDLHTIYVSPNQCAAWIIKEYNPTSTYDDRVYSNVHLELWNSEGLYIPAGINEYIEMIKTIIP